MISLRLPAQSFSTAEFLAAERHEAWENRHWPSVAPFYQTTPLVPFETSSLSTSFGGIGLSFAEITGQAWERGPAMIRSRQSDALGVNIGLIGSARGQMGDRDFHHPAGAALFTDLAQPSRHKSTGGRSLMLVVPRKIATEAGLDVAEMHGLVLDSPATQMLTSHILRIRDVLPQLMEEDGPRLARSVLDLIMLAVGTSGRAEDTVAAAASSSALLRAQAKIDENLGSPSLTVANLCRQLQVSRSTLHRIFEDEGGVQTYIRNRRLDAVRQALRERHNVERIGVLAERLGFSDAAHLSRLFRQRFGQSPSDCRASAMQPDW